MINWDVLGIEATKDEAAIRKAYKTQLSHTNPEDDPEAFMVLRQAYEKALDYARGTGVYAQPETEESEEADETLTGDLLPPDHPAYAWSKDLQALYMDFSRRRDPKAWETLYADPLCTRVDTAADTLDATLCLLMEHWYVPDAAIRLLDKVYDLTGQVQQLKETYPDAFVDAVLMAPLSRTGGGFDFGAFLAPEGTPYTQYDLYMHTYYDLGEMVTQGETEDAWAVIAELEDMPVRHPYTQVEKIKLYLQADDLQKAEKTVDTIWPAYRHTLAVACIAGETALSQEAWDLAGDRFRAALEDWPLSAWAHAGLAEVLYNQGCYDEAEQHLALVLDQNRYDQRGQFLQLCVDKAVKEQLQQKLDAVGTDGSSSITDEEKLRLATLDIDADEFDAGIELLNSLHLENREDEARRLHYLGRAYLETDRYEAALDAFRTSEQIIRELEEVEADPGEKARMNGLLCYSMIMETMPLEYSGRLEEALQIAVNATVDYPKAALPYCRQAELLYKLRRYPEAIEAATRSIERDDEFHLPLRVRAQANYQTGHYTAAFEDCEACIDLFPGDIEAYCCRIDVLREVGETDAALDELDSLEEETQGTRLTFMRAQVLQAAGRREEAIACLQKVLTMDGDAERERDPAVELSSMEQVYYTLYDLYLSKFEDEGGNHNWQAYHVYMETGLKLYPDSVPLLDAEAGDLYSHSLHEKAQPLYQRMVSLAPNAPHYAQLAGNELQLDRFEEAERHLDMAVKLDPELTYTHILLGCLHMHQRAYEAALAAFDRAEELAKAQDEQWVRLLREKAWVYARMQRFDEAIDCLRRNYELYERTEDYVEMMSMHRFQGHYEEAAKLGEAYIKENGQERAIWQEFERLAADLDDEKALLTCRSTDALEFTDEHEAGRFYMYRPGAYRTALRYFLKAEELDDSNIDNEVYLAMVYLKLRDTLHAELCAQRALDMVPKEKLQYGDERPFYLSYSAMALCILGRYAEARDRLEQALRGRPCDTCPHAGCIDAYIGLLYLSCLQGDTETAQKIRETGLSYAPHDRDLLLMPAHYMVTGKKEKKGVKP